MPPATAENAGLLEAEQKNHRPLMSGPTTSVGSKKSTPNNMAMQGSSDTESGDMEAAEYIKTQGIRGNLHKRNIEKIQNLVDDKPDDVLRVIRSWLPAEAEA